MAGAHQMFLAAPDPRLARVVSLLHFDGANGSTAFTDQRGKVWTRAGNAQISTAQSRFGGASGLFDGLGDRISTPSHADFNFAAGEFTVEGFVRFNSLAAAGNQGLICRDEIGGTRGWLLFAQGAGSGVEDALGFAAWVGGTDYFIGDTVPMVAGGAFTHVAAVRDQSGGSDVLRLYKDGTQVGSKPITGSVGAPNQPCVIGTLWGLGSPIASDLNAWVDEVRITKGACWYPGGASFAPPPLPFPNG